MGKTMMYKEGKTSRSMGGFFLLHGGRAARLAKLVVLDQQ